MKSRFRPLPRSSYLPSAEVVAPLLLGHTLIRNMPDGPVGGLIVETEAYLFNDPACHAFRGRTPRNQVMWGEPGHAYVYFIYGCYYCFNASCLPDGAAEAVLVRAIEPTLGLESMRQIRPAVQDQHLTDGPGKLCLAMAIDRALDGVDLCDASSPIYIAANPEVLTVREQLGPQTTTTRIGLKQAADLPLRFYLDGSRFVSRRAPRIAKTTVPREKGLSE